MQTDAEMFHGLAVAGQPKMPGEACCRKIEMTARLHVTLSRARSSDEWTERKRELIVEIDVGRFKRINASPPRANALKYAFVNFWKNHHSGRFYIRFSLFLFHIFHPNERAICIKGKRFVGKGLTK